MAIKLGDFGLATKLEYDGEIYYTPLWHHELVYTINSSNNILIVQCEPSLPEFMSIDEYNNLYINSHY